MKSRNLTQSSIRNDPFNRRMQGYSFRIFEDEDGVQDVISSSSFNKSLILSIQMTRKSVKNTLEQTARELEFYTERIWRLIANPSSAAKNDFKKNENEFPSLDLMDSLRSTIAMRRLFTNPRCPSSTVGCFHLGLRCFHLFQFENMLHLIFRWI